MKPRTSSTLIYFIAFIALGITRASLGPTLPGLAEQSMSSIQQIGYVFTARALGNLLGAKRGGHLYDRLPGHALNAATLIGSAILLALVPLASTLWMLLLVMFGLGVVESALDVGTNTMIVWQHRTNAVPFLNALHFSFGVGAFMAPIVVAQSLLLDGGIRWAYWAMALIVLPISFLFPRLPSPKAEILDTGSAARPPDRLVVALIVLFSLFYVGLEVSFSGWLTTYALESGLGDAAWAAYLTSGFFAAYTLGRLLSILVATRVKPRTILTADLMGSVISLVIILIAGAASPLLVWIGTLGLGISIASIAPTVLAYIGQRLSVSGRTTGYFFIGGSLGGMILPWLIGVGFEAVGPHIIPWSVLGMTLAASALLFGIFSSSRSPSVSQEPIVSP